MSYDRDDYWQEAFEIAMEEAGCGALLAQMTDTQRAEIGGALSGSADCQGMAFPTPANPMIAENARLERKLKWERELIVCPECKGSGWTTIQGPYHSCTSRCFKCNGRGKVHPAEEREPA